MASRKMVKFRDWEAEKLKDDEFVTLAREMEPGYQIARLRIKEGLTQKELADRVGTQQPAIARIENGTTTPTLTTLKKISDALNAKVCVEIIPN